MSSIAPNMAGDSAPPVWAMKLTGLAANLGEHTQGWVSTSDEVNEACSKPPRLIPQLEFGDDVGSAAVMM
jgi:hypothetical protein